MCVCVHPMMQYMVSGEEKEVHCKMIECQLVLNDDIELSLQLTESNTTQTNKQFKAGASGCSKKNGFCLCFRLFTPFFHRFFLQLTGANVGKMMHLLVAAMSARSEFSHLDCKLEGVIVNKSIGDAILRE